MHKLDSPVLLKSFQLRRKRTVFAIDFRNSPHDFFQLTLLDPRKYRRCKNSPGWLVLCLVTGQVPSFKSDLCDIFIIAIPVTATGFCMVCQAR